MKNGENNFNHTSNLDENYFNIIIVNPQEKHKLIMQNTTISSQIISRPSIARIRMVVQLPLLPEITWRYAKASFERSMEIGVTLKSTHFSDLL